MRSVTIVVAAISPGTVGQRVALIMVSKGCGAVSSYTKGNCHGLVAEVITINVAGSL